MVAKTRDNGKTWMNYCRDIRNHFTELDMDKAKQLAFEEDKLQRKAVAFDLKIKKYDNAIDALKETT